MTACRDSRGNWFIVAYADLEPGGTVPVPSGPGRFAPDQVARCQDGNCPESGDEDSLVMPGGAEPDDVPESRPNVYVLQADPAVREQVRGVARSAGLHVRSFSRAEDFLRAVQPDQIGCAVVEAEMPGTNGLEVQHGLAARRIPIPVIMITEPTKLATAIEAIKAGAFDVIEKPYVGARILAAIQAAIVAQQSRRQEQQASGDVRRRYAQLTTRERQVLELVAAGFRSREIAARLEIREKTVEVYRSRVNHKMNAHNAAELAQMLHCMKL